MSSAKSGGRDYGKEEDEQLVAAGQPKRGRLLAGSNGELSGRRSRSRGRQQ